MDNPDAGAPTDASRQGNPNALYAAVHAWLSYAWIAWILLLEGVVAPARRQANIEMEPQKVALDENEDSDS